MKILYAIAGRAGAGKDTTASMLAFLYHRYIIGGEDYSKWFDVDKSILNRHIFHFADTLKLVIQILYGIEPFKLQSRKYKDEMYFDLNTHEFVEAHTLTVKDNILNIERIEEFGLRKALDSCNLLGYRPLISIRTLLQYFGTNICRYQLDDHIWTNSTLGKVTEMLHNVDDVYIADMRFKEEYDSLMKFKVNHPDIQVITIFINRPENANSIANNHISENICFICDYTINNDGTLEDLFNKVKDIFNENY